MGDRIAVSAQDKHPAKTDRILLQWLVADIKFRVFGTFKRYL